MEINLVDSNFLGRDLNIKSIDLKWVTNNVKVSNHIFFTDNELDKVKKLKTNQKKVAWLLEPKAISPNIYSYISENFSLFDYILTFDRDIINLTPNSLFSPYGTYWVEDRFTYNKDKLVSMVMSFKNHTQGQELRHKILNQFRESTIDFYGKFNPKRMVISKNQALDNYYFSIAVENSIQNSYWTEKLLDCFITKTIPIYYGTRDITTFFNENGIIFFNSEKELNTILNYITPEVYNDRKHYIEENYILAKKYKEPENYIFDNYRYLLS